MSYYADKRPTCAECADESCPLTQTRGNDQVMACPSFKRKALGCGECVNCDQGHPERCSKGDGC